VSTSMPERASLDAALGESNHTVDPLTAFMSAQRQKTSSRGVLKNRSYAVRTFLMATPDFLAVTDDDVEEWLRSKHLSPKSVRTWRGHLRAFYGWAYELGLTDVKRMAPLGGPGTAKTASPEGLTGMVFQVVSAPWREALSGWKLWMRAAGRPNTTVRLREYQLRRFAADTLRDPWEVTSEDLIAWVATQRWAPESRRSYRSALRSFYGWGHEAGHTTKNAAAMLPPVPLPIRAPHPAPDDVLFEALQKCDGRLRLMVLLAARLGLRRGEIAKVHSDDIVTSPLGWSLHVVGKGRRQRVLPLAGELREVLTAAAPGYAFPGQIDGHLSPAYVGKLVSRVLGPGWATHGLRHRFATAAYAGQRDLFAVQALLGHSRPETTMQYVALPDGALRAAVGAASETWTVELRRTDTPRKRLAKEAHEAAAGEEAS
jgi:integrase